MLWNAQKRDIKRFGVRNLDLKYIQIFEKSENIDIQLWAFSQALQGEIDRKSIQNQWKLFKKMYSRSCSAREPPETIGNGPARLGDPSEMI